MLYGTGFVMLMLWIVYNHLENKIIASKKLLSQIEDRITELEERLSELSDVLPCPDEEDDLDIVV